MVLWKNNYHMYKLNRYASYFESKCGMYTCTLDCSISDFTLRNICYSHQRYFFVPNIIEATVCVYNRNVFFHNFKLISRMFYRGCIHRKPHTKLERSWWQLFPSICNFLSCMHWHPVWSQHLWRPQSMTSIKKKRVLLLNPLSFMCKWWL